MATLIRVPALGIAIANVVINEWLVREGESVAKGQALLDVQTDKITVEVPAEVSGVLLKVLFQAEAQLAVGAPIAVIGAAQENIDDLLAEVEAELAGMPVQESGPAATGVAAARAPAPARDMRASPLAKRLAREKGIDLSRVQPTGSGGRITQDDVRSYAEQDSTASDEVETIPLKGTRKVIADNMVRSVHTSPHYTMGIDVDCSSLAQLRDGLRRDKGVDLTYVPFVVKAIALAVKEHPIVNARVQDDAIVVQKVAHVGVAVASGDYIFVPVIRAPGEKSIPTIAKEFAELVQAVRDNRLTPAHLAGGTITVTNVGVADVNVKAGMSIINQPEVASVTMGRAQDSAVVVDGHVVVRPVMGITFTYDHRVVMGLPGALFAERVKLFLESPGQLLGPNLKGGERESPATSLCSG